MTTSSSNHFEMTCGVLYTVILAFILGRLLFSRKWRIVMWQKLEDLPDKREASILCYESGDRTFTRNGDMFHPHLWSHVPEDSILPCYSICYWFCKCLFLQLSYWGGPVSNLFPDIGSLPSFSTHTRKYQDITYLLHGAESFLRS